MSLQVRKITQRTTGFDGSAAADLRLNLGGWEIIGAFQDISALFPCQQSPGKAVPGEPSWIGTRCIPRTPSRSC